MLWLLYLFPCLNSTIQKLNSNHVWKRDTISNHSRFVFIMLPYLLPLLQVVSFYWLQFLLVSGLVIRIISSKASQECTAIMNLKVHNICVVWKVWHLPWPKCLISLFIRLQMQDLGIISFFLIFFHEVRHHN